MLETLSDAPNPLLAESRRSDSAHIDPAEHPELRKARLGIAGPGGAQSFVFPDTQLRAVEVILID